MRPTQADFGWSHRLKFHGPSEIFAELVCYALKGAAGDLIAIHLH
jgi:hypothetical protein